MSDELSRYFYGELTTTLSRTAIADMFEQHGWKVTLTNTMWYEEFEVSNELGVLRLFNEKPVLLVGEIAESEMSISATDTVLGKLQVEYSYESLRIQDDLVHEIWRRDISAIKKLLAAGANPNLRGRSWSSAIACAGENDNAGEIVRLLVAAGANVNIQDEHGTTPLHHAVDIAIDGAFQTNKETFDWTVVGVFLALGADPQIRDNRGKTVFDCAASYGEYAQRSFGKFIAAS